MNALPFIVQVIVAIPLFTAMGLLTAGALGLIPSDD